MDKKQEIGAKKIVLIALLGAMLSAVKFALMALPNIELVTFLIVLFTVVAGGRITLPATLIFCSIELFLFGITPFAITYYIHWPFVVIVFSLLRKHLKTEIGFTVTVFIVTALFGVQSSLTYILIAGGLKTTDFWHKFIIIYMNGVIFYVTHIISNCLIMLFLIKPSKKILEQIYQSYIT